MRSSVRPVWNLLVLLAALLVLAAAAMACAGDKTPTPAAAPGAAPTPTAAPAVAPPTPEVKLQPQYGGTLRIAINLDAESLDPRLTNRRAEVPVFLLVYDTPVRLGAEWKLLPGLARSWDVSTDGKAVTFHLARGVKFHDGTDFNAQAVKWNYEWALDPKTEHRQRLAIEAMGIENITVADEATVTFQLKKPFRPMLSTLTVRPGFIPSPQAIEKLGQDFGRKPVGAGPFRFKEWKPGLSVTLVRNENYFEKGKPYLDSVTLQHVPDPSVRVAMLRTLETDVVEDVEAANVDVLRRGADTKLDIHQSARAYGYMINVTKEPFNNKALRQAIAYAINRQKIVDAVFLGGARVASGYEGAGWAYNPNLTIPYDPQKAKAKLAEAGYPGGVTIPSVCADSSAYLPYCEAVQAMLREVGINMEIKLVPFVDQWASILREETKFTVIWLSPITPDPSERLATWWRCGSWGNGSKYCNNQVDQLLDESFGIYDTVKAKRLTDEVQKILVDELPYIYDVWATIYTGLNKRVQNFVRTPDLNLRLAEVWLGQ